MSRCAAAVTPDLKYSAYISRDRGFIFICAKICRHFICVTANCDKIVLCTLVAVQKLHCECPQTGRARDHQPITYIIHTYCHIQQQQHKSMFDSNQTNCNICSCNKCHCVSGLAWPGIMVDFNSNWILYKFAVGHCRIACARNRQARIDARTET